MGATIPTPPPSEENPPEEENEENVNTKPPVSAKTLLQNVTLARQL